MCSHVLCFFLILNTFNLKEKTFNIFCADLDEMLFLFLCITQLATQLQQPVINCESLGIGTLSGGDVKLHTTRRRILLTQVELRPLPEQQTTLTKEQETSSSDISELSARFTLFTQRGSKPPRNNVTQATKFSFEVWEGGPLKET